MICCCCNHEYFSFVNCDHYNYSVMNNHRWIFFTDILHVKNTAFLFFFSMLGFEENRIHCRKNGSSTLTQAQC